MRIIKIRGYRVDLFTPIGLPIASIEKDTFIGACSLSSSHLKGGGKVTIEAIREEEIVPNE